MTIISGILKDRQGTVLAQASLTLTETDSKQTVITTTDNTGHYYIQLSPGTWRVMLGRGDAPPKDAGVIAITKDTAPGALDDYIASLQPSTLDIQVLGFMRGLVDEAERASEATSQAKQFADVARQGAQQAEQALKAAQEIAKTPGPKGDKGDPGPQGIPGKDGYQGKDGKSAYDVWASQQPAGSDTSVTAFMAYLKAIPGPKGDKGDKGDPGKDGVPGKSAWEIWVTQQPAGSDTSMAAYMTYQKGTPGPKGDPGPQGQQGIPGKNGTADLTGINTTTGIPSSGFNYAKSYPLYANEPSTPLPNHPLSGVSGNDAWGVMWVIPRGFYPAQIFLNYNGQMFSRISANYGWSPWWQMAGVPVAGYVGTERRLSYPVAVTYGQQVSGNNLTPSQSGTWMAKGDAAPNEKITYIRIR
ncbi:TPA: prophage tail fiber N-terminal domain-containing protein [Salmonella enterica subsp. enterica serovar Muenchen]|nr:hypothetical protein [Salmonella enterica]